MTKKKLLKILMLEDSKEDIFLIKRELNKSDLQFEMMEVDDEEEYRESLGNYRPDIILSDHALPQFNSLEALKICQKYDAFLPFILVTGAVSEEFAAQCIKNGADDYVLKSNLKRLATSIEQSIRHRKHEKKRKKAEDLLRKQNEELMKINSELDSFVYNISHNLRAPLLSLIGLINLASLEKEIIENEKINEYLDLINKSVKKLDNTLMEILDYSRNARGQITYEQIDLKSLIEDCFQKTKYIVADHEISEKIEIAGKQDFASDNHRLNVIFLNLISNAVKYQDPSKDHNTIHVKIEIDKEKAGISIADNGIGIAEDKLDKIFGMFYRATSRSDGSGLGLYIVKESIVKLGGEISVDSVKDEGTTFNLTIPNRIDLI